MQSLKKIMADLGFNKEAPLETQKAFFKHLAKVAEQNHGQRLETQTKVEKKSPVPTQKHSDHVQLEFDFSSDDSKKQVS